MAQKYGVASDYIKYTSRIKSDTSDGVAVEASQVVDLEEDKLQSDINKELKASIASASGNTYSKSEIDSKDSATLTSAKRYADTKKTEAVSAAATDATTKANSALASAKSYADEKVSALGSVYTTKGSCTAAQLKALTSAKAGDVWNITDAINIDGKAYPAGVNVVCVTAFSAAIDPAATKNWDALQGLQDLTSYAKKSEIEDTAVANVKFAQEEDVPQDNGVSFKKTITYVNGREATTESDFNLLPATSTKAGVMSAADKVKLDAVDGKIGDVQITKTGTGYKITDEYDAHPVNIGSNTNIGENVIISGAAIIGTDDRGGGLFIKLGTTGNINEGPSSFICIGAELNNGVKIGTNDYDKFYLGNKNNDASTIGVNSHIGDNITIGTGAIISSGAELNNGIIIGTGDNDSFVFTGNNAGPYNSKIGKDIEISRGVSLGTQTNGEGYYVEGIAFYGGTGAFGMNSNGDFSWTTDDHNISAMKTAATTDDLSALATRVSTLEDLLKLA